MLCSLIRKCTSRKWAPGNIPQKMHYRKCASKNVPPENVHQKMCTRKCPSLFASTRKIIHKSLFTHQAQAARHKSLHYTQGKTLHRRYRLINHAQLRISGYSIVGLATDSWNSLYWLWLLLYNNLYNDYCYMVQSEYSYTIYMACLVLLCPPNSYSTIQGLNPIICKGWWEV